MRALASVIVLILPVWQPSAAQDRRPLGVVDMIELPSIQDPQLSPYGTRILFVMDAPDWKANRRLGHVYASAPTAPGKCSSPSASAASRVRAGHPMAAASPSWHGVATTRTRSSTCSRPKPARPGV